MGELEQLKKLFYELVKINDKEKNILFWGCLHYHHRPDWEIPLWKQRGFETGEDHDKTLIDNWNSKANEETIGFLLGDNVLGKGSYEMFSYLINTLKYKELYMMPGNHYAGWRQIFEHCQENIYKINDNKKVIFVPNYLEAFVNGHPVVMSHYPILSWNGQGKGSFMLYAHVHGSLQKSELGRLYQKTTKSLEVSVDVNKYPLDFSEVRAALENKKIKQVDHHGSETQNPF